MKKITILKSLIDNAIEDHFESEGIYDYLESSKTEFSIDFKFNQGQKLSCILEYNVRSKAIYKNKDVSVIDEQGNVYSLEDGNLIISSKNYNPNALTISQRIDDIIEHEERKRDEHKDTEYDHEKGTIRQ